MMVAPIAYLIGCGLILAVILVFVAQFFDE